MMKESRADLLASMSVVAGNAYVKTWADVQAAAREDVLLNHLVAVVDRGGAPKEQALIAAVLHQADLLRAYRDAHAERLALSPAPPIILCKDCPARGAFGG